MTRTFLIFFGSAISSLIILYILGIIWFGDNRNRMVRSFFVLGVITTYLIVFNGITAVVSEQLFPAMLSIGMVFTCALPFALLWFSLHYTKSPLALSTPLLTLSIALPAVDILMMLTTSVHGLYFTDYSFPVPGKGILFWVHSAVCLVVVLLAFVRIITHAAKTRSFRSFPFFAGIGILISASVHTLYALFSAVDYDLSSICFLLTFLLFAFSVHRSRIFKFRRMTVDQIFSSLDDVFLICNEHGIIIESNLAAKTAFPEFPVTLGTTRLDDFIEHVDKRLSRRLPKNLFDSIRGRVNRCAGEICVPGNNGQSKIYALNWHTITPNTATRGYMLSLSDISDQRAMFEEINKKNRRLRDLNTKAMAASKAKSAFLANMSHEIRTPLNAIIGMSHIARESIEDRAKATSSIDQVIRASKHLLELLNNVLDMSKIESGKFTLAAEPFCVETVIDEVISIFSRQCADKCLNLIPDITGLPETVIGDSLRFKQVLINLMGNAVKFTDPGGSVCLAVNGETTADTAELHVQVRDSGIGMSQEQLSRLFTAFEQANSSISVRYGGTGIGLAISQHLIGLMGSAITVESREGAGSSFSFSIKLPIGTSPVPGGKGTSFVLPDLSEKRILLVDDVEINRIIMSELLSKTNAVIEEAEDGVQAVRMVEQSPEYHYDLIFMDVQMPNMDGYEAARQIRAMPRGDTAALPIVAMTANAYREDVEKALASGMTAHLAKPVDINKFYGILTQIILTEHVK